MLSIFRGGSIELELANRGAKVYGYDIFTPVTDFWQVLLKEPKKLAEIAQKYYPLTSSKFYSLQREYGSIKNKKERAAIFFALNRSSFSGTTFSGGMSLGHKRYTLNNIKYLETFKAKNLIVKNADFHDSLKKHENDFLYLNPLYANGGKLYGDKGSTHHNFDHEGLAEIITNRDRWILSYNDSPKVRSLYKDFTILPIKWAYGMNNTKKSNEVLILSNDFIKT